MDAATLLVTALLRLNEVDAIPVICFIEYRLPSVIPVHRSILISTVTQRAPPPRSNFSDGDLQSCEVHPLYYAIHTPLENTLAKRSGSHAVNCFEFPEEPGSPLLPCDPRIGVGTPHQKPSMRHAKR